MIEDERTRQVLLGGRVGKLRGQVVQAPARFLVPKQRAHVHDLLLVEHRDENGVIADAGGVFVLFRRPWLVREDLRCFPLSHEEVVFRGGGRGETGDGLCWRCTGCVGGKCRRKGLYRRHGLCWDIVRLERGGVQQRRRERLLASSLRQELRLQGVVLDRSVPALRRALKPSFPALKLRLEHGKRRGDGEASGGEGCGGGGEGEG